jgi:hypothetical protein
LIKEERKQQLDEVDILDLYDSDSSSIEVMDDVKLLPQKRSKNTD